MSMKINMTGGSLVIEGKAYTNIKGELTFDKNQVLVDGKPIGEYDGTQPQIDVHISGDVQLVNTTNGKVYIDGNAKCVSTTNGSVTIIGDVEGDITTNSGNVYLHGSKVCGDITNKGGNVFK